MGMHSAAEIDQWLNKGGIVLTASDRATRHLCAAFHQRRRSEGLSAWPAPAIHSFSAFLRNQWLQRTRDDRLLLNSAQEQSLWARIAATERTIATLLDRPRHHLAGLASDAQSLLCDYAPRLLRPSARVGWAQDAFAFSTWLSTFDQTCARERLLSPSRIPLELIPILQSDSSPRPALLLVGFDRILPTQLDFLNAWGHWKSLSSDQPTTDLRVYSAPDSASELVACAQWCAQNLATNPSAQILVLSQEIATRRGQIERTFLRASAPPFEFSLGIPLSSIPLPRAALLHLRWLTAPLEEHEIDWLFSSGFAASQEESIALQARMRDFRARNLQSPQWALRDFLDLPAASPAPPASWLARTNAAQQRLAAEKRRMQAPLDWTTLVPTLLADLGLPGDRRLSSPEFQALDRWQQSLDTCASLGFDNAPISWPDFLSTFERILDETLFALESSSAPILIAGPAESAGLSADAIWFLGADEDSWPARAPAHPLIPLSIQREYSMPHASPQLDLDLAASITSRLLTAAPLVSFSFALQTDDAETRSSRLIRSLAGDPQPLPAELLAPAPPAPLTQTFADESEIPLPTPNAPLRGGAALLTAQSQCPFQAFAKFRLDANTWDAAEPSFTAAQRGLLLHSVLHSIWSPPPDGIHSRNDLRAIADLQAFVESHVRVALKSALPKPVLARMPHTYLEIEAQRLTSLIKDWLAYEAVREPFTVVATEDKSTVAPAGLKLHVRLDRLDRLSDESLLVIDYKTSPHKPSAWENDRPEDVQLPLYACFALSPGQKIGGLVFAQVLASKPAFSGLVRDAISTLDPSIGARTALVTKPLSDTHLAVWRTTIESLASDFLAGRADVDPLDPIKTCEQCGLHTLCRIAERDHLFLDEDEYQNNDEEDTDA